MYAATCGGWYHPMGLVFRSMNNRGALPGNWLQSPECDGRGNPLRQEEIGVPALAPHDLRHKFAKLAHTGHSALEQIQLSLGHASIQTTERYLGVAQNLTNAPCDYLGLRLKV